MCGRLNLSDLDGIRALMAELGLPLFNADWTPRFNVAPSQSLPCVLAGGGAALPRAATAHWGLPLGNGRLAINARAESAADKATFRALLRQRALVPANGFYEWQRRHRERHAWHFLAESAPALALAALWREGERGPELALLTTAANALMAPVHHRMPVAIAGDTAAAWLAGQAPLDPPLAAPLRAHRVGHWVDNATHEGPECLADPTPRPHTPDLFD